MKLRKSGSAAGSQSADHHSQPAGHSAGVLSSISFATGDPRAGSVMAGMIVLSVTLRFLQEARAGAAAAKLKAMIHVTATVVRDGKPQEIPLRDLVPGDIINLSAGDMIPGDVRILSAKDLCS
jgi:Mg2+-importing ATPase